METVLACAVNVLVACRMVLMAVMMVMRKNPKAQR
jgi:hypothetical protein